MPAMPQIALSAGWSKLCPVSDYPKLPTTWEECPIYQNMLKPVFPSLPPVVTFTRTLAGVVWFDSESDCDVPVPEQEQPFIPTVFDPISLPITRESSSDYSASGENSEDDDDECVIGKWDSGDEWIEQQLKKSVLESQAENHPELFWG